MKEDTTHKVPDSCEEHGLHYYRDGFVYTCKLGCVYQDHLKP